MPLILVAGVVVGIVVAELICISLVKFGAVDVVIPAELSRTMFREMGPLMTGLLVSGRVGAAIGAELAVLRITEQIDALESLGIHSFRLLVITRVIACTLALPILTTAMSFAEIAGRFSGRRAMPRCLSGAMSSGYSTASDGRIICYRR